MHTIRPTTTKVYDTYWQFACERQKIFFNRIENPHIQNWTADPILAEHKFTNVYRASDRVSQYLIKNVIHQGSQSFREVFFRTILFKIFNKIETWELLSAQLTDISWDTFNFDQYDRILSNAMNNSASIYSAAYIMASGRSFFNYKRKHQNHLKLIEKMMGDKVPERIAQSPSLEDIFKLLNTQPSIGNFLAYQYSIDLNYSNCINFSENDFVMPGPGALRGIEKCFSDMGTLSPQGVIKYAMERQAEEIEERDLSFKSLWGRNLHLIDIQNLFCEVDKYSRVYHPDIISSDRRKRIKQKFKPKDTPVQYWFPPKWEINNKIKQIYRRENCALI